MASSGSSTTPLCAKEEDMPTKWDAFVRRPTCWCKDPSLLKVLKIRNAWFAKEEEMVRKKKGESFIIGMSDIQDMKANMFDGDNEELVYLLELNVKKARRMSI